MRLDEQRLRAQILRLQVTPTALAPAEGSLLSRPPIDQSFATDPLATVRLCTHLTGDLAQRLSVFYAQKKARRVNGLKG